MVGSTTPRIWTPPLRELTPETTYGYDLIDFADTVLGIEFDPWQRWLACHLGELLEDGRPRFRTVLVLVARQNGKTLFAQALTLYWLFVEQAGLVLGTSTTRGYAKESWVKVVEMAKNNPWLARELRDPNPTRETVGEECLYLNTGGQLRFSAANRRAGRSLTVHRLVLDEIREHNTFDAWGASTNAMQAVPKAQAVAISNQGDSTAVVLDFMRDGAMATINGGGGDLRAGLFEWSSPEGSEPDDPAALAQANPSLGIRIDLDTLIGQARSAMASGGPALATFRTEVMCSRVNNMESAIDGESWDNCGLDEYPVDLADHRDKVAACLDVSNNGDHATLLVAADIDGVTYLDVIHSWHGYGCASQVRADLPALIKKIRPRRFGWFPSGPAAGLAADLRSNWAPRGTEVEQIIGDDASACMALAHSVIAKTIAHTKDPLLTAHIGRAKRRRRGDAWKFDRPDSGPIDAAYAAAGAVFLARSLGPPKPDLFVAVK